MSLQGKSADIFALGLVFYYVFSGGQHPFEGSKAEEDFSTLDENIKGKKYRYV